MTRSTSFDDDGREATGRAPLDRPICVSDGDVREFQGAMEVYKQRSGRLFPTWSEILEVLLTLGYAKRIWRPVEAWSPLATDGTVGPPGDDESVGVFAWFSRVETPSGP